MAESLSSSLCLKILCDLNPAHFLGSFCAPAKHTILNHTMLFIVCVCQSRTNPYPHALYLSIWNTSWRPSLILHLEAGPLWAFFLRTLCDPCICWFVLCSIVDCMPEQGNVSGNSEAPAKWVVSWNDLSLGVIVFSPGLVDLPLLSMHDNIVLAFHYYNKMLQTINLGREKAHSFGGSIPCITGVCSRANAVGSWSGNERQQGVGS